ncbi:MAG TPA: NADPH:quinone reductase [Gordonia polyisoprenivorans]|nr:NADPH:quinone reductase [Gordonia polyisoprenivorans]
MRAVQFAKYGSPEVLEVVDIATPEPATGEVRIKVAAAGVNPVDASIRSGSLADMIPVTLPSVPGVDAAGTVDAVGPGVTDVRVGDTVFGSGRSTYAEYAVLASYARVPDGVSTEEAAGWGGPVETAVRVLDELEVQRGWTLFVSGASGGVGSAVIQLAVARGVTVIGSASEANQNRVEWLGATPVVYGDGLVERVRALASTGVDAALDVAGSGVIPQLIELTGDPSRVLSIADFSAPQHGVRVSQGGFGDRRENAFDEALALPGFSISVVERFPLAQAGIAQEHVATGHTPGKIVVVP